MFNPLAGWHHREPENYRERRGISPVKRKPPGSGLHNGHVLALLAILALWLALWCRGYPVGTRGYGVQLWGNASAAVWYDSYYRGWVYSVWQDGHACKVLISGPLWQPQHSRTRHYGNGRSW